MKTHDAKHVGALAAISSGTPLADIAGVGDGFATNAMVDNLLVSRDIAAFDKRLAK